MMFFSRGFKIVKGVFFAICCKLKVKLTLNCSSVHVDTDDDDDDHTEHRDDYSCNYIDPLGRRLYKDEENKHVHFLMPVYFSQFFIPSIFCIKYYDFSYTFIG